MEQAINISSYRAGGKLELLTVKDKILETKKEFERIKNNKDK